MASIERFEDIDAWKKSRELTAMIYQFSNEPKFSRDFALRDQVRRACISVMSNIAEGFERGGDQEFHQFLSLAKASVGEVRSQLYVALDAGYLDQTMFQRSHDLTLDIGRLVAALMRYLRESSQRGHKFA
jgi:four helix bundle protein